MTKREIPRRKALARIGATSLALAGVSVASGKPTIENTVDFDPNNLDEVRQFRRALVGEFGEPNERGKRVAIVNRLDVEQREAYYDATAVHWVRRHKYGVTTNPNVATANDVMLNNVSVERVNEDLTERWNWDVSDSRPERTELVDIDRKAQNIQREYNTTSGSVSGESTIGETVTASNSLSQVYEFSYEVTWEYS